MLHKIHSDIKCKVIAFPVEDFKFIKNFPNTVKTQFEMNEIQFINDFREKEARNNEWYLRKSNSMPYVQLYVPHMNETRNVHSCIDKPDREIEDIDIKNQFYYSAKRLRNNDVFISYSSANQNIADMLVESAKKNGVSCWIASKSMDAGSYAKQIVQGIREAKVFVVIVSSDSTTSPHVKNELNIATEHIKDGLVIMPFKLIIRNWTMTVGTIWADKSSILQTSRPFRRKSMTLLIQ